MLAPFRCPSFLRGASIGCGKVQYRSLEESCYCERNNSCKDPRCLDAHGCSRCRWVHPLPCPQNIFWWPYSFPRLWLSWSSPKRGCMISVDPCFWPCSLLPSHGLTTNRFSSSRRLCFYIINSCSVWDPVVITDIKKIQLYLMFT